MDLLKDSYVGMAGTGFTADKSWTKGTASAVPWSFYISELQEPLSIEAV
jgi:hypothetical protein